MSASVETYPEIREAVAKFCARFPSSYWRALDREMAYPAEFVNALTQSGWLSILIPEEYGGSGLPLSAAAAVLEEMQRAGCNSGVCHAQMYTMGTLLQHGSETKKRLYLPQIATGALRLQAFGVTEPSSGTDTDLLTAPVHPYTRGLLASVPDFRSETATGTKEIPGIPPNQAQLMPGCRFADRCDLVLPACHNHRPRLQTIAVGDVPHRVACPVVIAAEGIATHD